MSIRIAAITGSVRPGNFTSKALALVIDELSNVKKADVDLIDAAPREGLSGMIAFLHPRSTGGVLIELVDQDGARR